MSYVPGAEDIERKYDYWIEFGIKTERERVMAWLKFQTLQSGYDGLDWIDACLLLQKNFENEIKEENK
jgi:hypothetical protein